ncbi:hypothetical protein RHGRI_005548 [Rhododendron griersonianum]|uniref:Exostosin GT47 domain-containing protein n=1 Tax=Rhododendron griersonianum TaxID=479676 RepID=A0AAV6LF86_9ERIC|nr:hypothetical protein RHGRI_005548 [Rhododendron griersonianum]
MFTISHLTNPVDCGNANNCRAHTPREAMPNSTTHPSESYAMPTPPKASTHRKTSPSPKSTSTAATSTPNSSPRPPPPRPAAPRPHLAFFAGGARGPIRSSVLRHWKDLDTDIRVYEYLPENLDYYTLMLESKFCLCPSGYEVATPRTVEAIYAECVPVILSENYVLPFSDVLRWEEFSVAVEVSDIGRLKEILMGVGEEKYLRFLP